jgi:hypothetical protein
MKFFASLPSFLLAWGVCSACQLSMPPAWTAFDASEYVFIGEVTGIVGPLESETVRGEAWGLRIKVKEPVHLPRRPAEYVEVFEYGLSASCEAIGEGRDALLKYYPPGSVVRVIAKESTHFESGLPQGNVRLDGSPFNQRAIVSKVHNDEPIAASASSIYDFKRPFDLDAYEKRRKLRNDAYPLWFWYRGVVNFEFRKELLRLRNARSENDKAAILERLIRYPRSGEGAADMDYPAMVKMHVSDPERSSALIAAWKKRN